LNIATSKELIALSNPDDPLLKGPSFFDGSADALGRGREASYAVAFGRARGLRHSRYDALQEQLMYADVCAFPAAEALALMPELAAQPHVLSHCAAVADGVLQRGLASAVAQLDSELAPLTTARYSMAVAQLLYSVPVPTPLSPAEVMGAITSFTTLNQLLNDYLHPLLQLSGRLHLRRARAHTHDAEQTAMIVLVAMPIALIALHILLLRHRGRRLGQAAQQDNAMMLLLPRDAVVHLAEARAYIEANNK
jgi:hypothetical protein